MESHSHIVSSDPPETVRKLCLSTKFPHQEIRWNYSIFCGVSLLTIRQNVAIQGTFLDLFCWFPQCLLVFQKATIYLIQTSRSKSLSRGLYIVRLCLCMPKILVWRYRSKPQGGTNLLRGELIMYCRSGNRYKLARLWKPQISPHTKCIEIAQTAACSLSWLWTESV